MRSARQQRFQSSLPGSDPHTSWIEWNLPEKGSCFSEVRRRSPDSGRMQECNQRERIILGRDFLSAGMQSAEKNHPGERFFIRRDEISEEESSLGENFCWQRCNQQRRIIQERDFLSAGMKSEEKNHPWERIPIGRDEISKEESSRREIFYSQG